MTSIEDEIFDVDIGEQPARYKMEGNVSYRLSNGQYHRVGGPAIKGNNGSKYWYQHNKLHRLGGPAVELFDGDKFWYYKSKQHRLDGPAVERVGYPVYKINGFEYSKGGYPDAVRDYLIKSLSIPYNLPFFALSDYLDDLYANDPDFKFEGKSYHELADMIRKHYQ